MSRMDANEKTCQKATTIGGQALIEGPDDRSGQTGPAVRRADGEIVVEYLSRKSSKIESIPFLRASVSCQMVLDEGCFAALTSPKKGRSSAARTSRREKKGFRQKPEVFTAS